MITHGALLITTEGSVGCGSMLVNLKFSGSKVQKQTHVLSGYAAHLCQM